MTIKLDSPLNPSKVICGCCGQVSTRLESGQYSCSCHPSLMAYWDFTRDSSFNVIETEGMIGGQCAIHKKHYTMRVERTGDNYFLTLL